MSALHFSDDLKVLLLLIAATLRATGQDRSEDGGGGTISTCRLDPLPSPTGAFSEWADDRLLEFPAVSPNHLKT